MIWTTQQVADKLGISVEMVRDLVKRGELAEIEQPSKKGKRHQLRFDSRTVMDFKSAGKVPPYRSRRKPVPAPVPEPAQTPQSNGGVGYSYPDTIGTVSLQALLDAATRDDQADEGVESGVDLIDALEALSERLSRIEEAQTRCEQALVLVLQLAKKGR